jgi:hypothetical protein
MEAQPGARCFQLERLKLSLGTRLEMFVAARPSAISTARANTLQKSLTFFGKFARLAGDNLERTEGVDGLPFNKIVDTSVPEVLPYEHCAVNGRPTVAG